MRSSESSSQFGPVGQRLVEEFKKRVGVRLRVSWVADFLSFLTNRGDDDSRALRIDRCAYSPLKHASLEGVAALAG
jgi:hypothetical protein